MTKDEFIDGYCTRSGITREFFLLHGDAVPCDCGEGTCAGWQYDTQPDRADLFIPHAEEPEASPGGQFFICAQDAVGWTPAPGDLVIYAAGPREVVRFKGDGTIVLAEGYTPTEAAEAFIETLRHMLPSKVENDKLKARITELEVEWETTLDALADVALRECERAIRQREENLRTGQVTAEGGTHETCFKYAFKQVLSARGKP